ncbi:MAG: hypothetical protein NZM11_00930 [Anaerolineales bacterium]|nr:hypothetical protein [Anaerolineales bacterium]
MLDHKLEAACKLRRDPHAQSKNAEPARQRARAHLERLAISPQCGLATSIGGNAISPADQFRKLRVLAETARKPGASGPDSFAQQHCGANKLLRNTHLAYQQRKIQSG